MNDLKNEIRAVRKTRGLTLEQLAEAIGLSTSYLSRLESGDRQLDVRHAVKIAKVLACSLADLFPEDSPQQTLTPRQSAMLNLFNQLPEGEQDRIMKIADALSQPGPAEKKEAG